MIMFDPADLATLYGVVKYRNARLASETNATVGSASSSGKTLDGAELRRYDELRADLNESVVDAAESLVDDLMRYKADQQFVEDIHRLFNAFPGPLMRLVNREPMSDHDKARVNHFAIGVIGSMLAGWRDMPTYTPVP